MYTYTLYIYTLLYTYIYKYIYIGVGSKIIHILQDFLVNQNTTLYCCNGRGAWFEPINSLHQRTTHISPSTLDIICIVCLLRFTRVNKVTTCLYTYFYTVIFFLYRTSFLRTFHAEYIYVYIRIVQNNLLFMLNAQLFLNQAQPLSIIIKW